MHVDRIEVYLRDIQVTQRFVKLFKPAVMPLLPDSQPSSSPLIPRPTRRILLLISKNPVEKPVHKRQNKTC
ncbi:hypothetical protein CABS03_07042 [Colletotrichum abscissum]